MIQVESIPLRVRLWSEVAIDAEEDEARALIGRVFEHYEQHGRYRVIEAVKGKVPFEFSAANLLRVVRGERHWVAGVLYVPDGWQLGTGRPGYHPAYWRALADFKAAFREIR